MPLAPGEIVGVRYRIERRIATGGMGEVWVGRHLDLGFEVAIKRVLPGGAANHEAIARFKREAQLLGRIQSDHVARVLDFVHDDASGLLLVMELIPGEVLADVLSKRRLTVEETVELGADLATALCDLHACHIVHRDLKPGNVILRSLPDGRRRAVLIDLGISRIVSGASEGDDDESLTGITKTNMVLGTVEYMAPEQILSSRKVGYGADIYALGAILFRAVAGKHVFGDVKDGMLARAKLMSDAPRLELGRSDRVSAGLVSVVARALERHTAKRFEDTTLMMAELTALRELARASSIVDLDSVTTTHDLDAGVLAAALEKARSPAAPRVGESGLPRARAFISDDTTETVDTVTVPTPPAKLASAVEVPASAVEVPAAVVRTPARALEPSADAARRMRRGQLAGLVGGLVAGVVFGLGVGMVVRRGATQSTPSEGVARPPATAASTVSATASAPASVEAPVAPPAPATNAPAAIEPAPPPDPGKAEPKPATDVKPVVVRRVKPEAAQGSPERAPDKPAPKPPADPEFAPEPPKPEPKPSAQPTAQAAASAAPSARATAEPAATPKPSAEPE